MDTGALELSGNRGFLYKVSKVGAFVFNSIQYLNAILVICITFVIFVTCPDSEPGRRVRTAQLRLFQAQKRRKGENLFYNTFATFTSSFSRRDCGEEGRRRAREGRQGSQSREAASQDFGSNVTSASNILFNRWRYHVMNKRVDLTRVTIGT